MHFAQRARDDRRRTNLMLVWASIVAHAVMSAAVVAVGVDPGWRSMSVVFVAQLWMASRIRSAGPREFIISLLALVLLFELRIIQLGIFGVGLPPMTVAMGTMLLGYGLTLVELPGRWPIAIVVGVHGFPILASVWWPDILPTVGKAFLGVSMLFSLAVTLLFSARRAQLAHLTRQLSQEAELDRLTGTATRPRFLRRVERHLRRAQHDRLPVSLLFLEVHAPRLDEPRFETALAVIGATLRDTLRPTDLIGRVGERTFGVFLEGDQPNVALSRLQARVVAATREEVGLRVGVAHTKGNTDLVALLGGAEEALANAQADQPVITRDLTPIGC